MVMRPKEIGMTVVKDKSRLTDVSRVNFKLNISNEDAIDWEKFFGEINTDADDVIGIGQNELSELLEDLDNFTPYRNIAGRSNVDGYNPSLYREGIIPYRR